MTSTPTYDLLIYGRAAAKAGEAAEARRYLERMLNMDPPEEERAEALYWLSEVSSDPKEQRSLLEEILANNFGDARARRKLAILDGKIRPDEIVDPDRIPAPRINPDHATKVKIQAFNCPKCGARMIYAPDGQTLMCEFCDSRQGINAVERPGTLGQGQGPEDDFIVAMLSLKGHNRPVSMQSVTCNGCGANFILPPEEITQVCPYCDTPYAVNQIEVRTLDAPDGVVPFSVGKDQAREAVHAWLAENPPTGKVKLAPPVGVYLPAWLFNIGGQMDWNGEVVRNKKVVPISGVHIVGCDNLLVPACKPSEHFPAELRSFWKGYQLSGLQPYDARYLAGILAENFSITAGDASLVARERALRIEKEKVLTTEVERDIQDLVVHSTNMLVDSYRLILLPLWRTYLLVNDNRYDLVINGQTGAITGKHPDGGLIGWLKEWW